MESLNREGLRPPFTPIKVLDMVIGRRYKVLCMRSVNTRYGIKPVVDLDTGESIFLPAKYAKAVPREDLSRLHVQARYTYLIFYGTESDQWSTPILKFSTGEETVNIEQPTFPIRNVEALEKVLTLWTQALPVADSTLQHRHRCQRTLSVD